MIENFNYLLEDSIGYIVRNFTKALREKLLAEFHKEGFELSIEEWIALAFLWRFQDKNQQQLGELLLQDKTAVTRLIDNMQKNDLVIRIVNPNDKRNKIINLTENGKKLYKEIVIIVQNTLSIAFKNITKEEIDNCKSTINKMKLNLENDVE
jgi:DNA-binding MarR family transcriptional regulator